MKDKHRYDTSQLFNFARGSYLERTSRPIYALTFLLPFIIFYELGTIFISTNVLRYHWQGRVVAFSWVQKFLEYIGFSSKLAWVATPLAVVIILIALQLASKKQWRFLAADFVPMTIECILLAVPLIVLSLFLNSQVQSRADVSKFAAVAQKVRAEPFAARVSTADQPAESPAEPARPAQTAPKLLADIVTGIGAGIYEELVFRLILICLLMLLFQDALQLNHKNATMLSILVSAALFSAYHHVDFFTGRIYQNPFSWTEFGFRTAAGVYFAVLFSARGFGITAGTHAFYDVIATAINSAFFSTGN